MHWKTEKRQDVVFTARTPGTEPEEKKVGDGDAQLPSSCFSPLSVEEEVGDGDFHNCLLPAFLHCPVLSPRGPSLLSARLQVCPMSKYLFYDTLYNASRVDFRRLARLY